MKSFPRRVETYELLPKMSEIHCCLSQHEQKQGNQTDINPTTSTHVETVALLSKLNTKDHLDIEIGEDELSEIDFSKEATYGEISQVHKVGVNSPSG